MEVSDLFVLVGLEESQAITKAFRAIGVNAYSCDIKPCSGGHPEWHIQGDVFQAIKAGLLITQDGALIHVNKWHGAIFHPVCTYLTVTANKWLKDQPERKSGALVGEARREAIEFFMKLAESDIDNISIENPVGCMSSVWRKPDQIIQPMQFGHPEPKKTCLWLKGFPLLKATHHGIEPDYHTSKSGKRMPRWYAYADKSQGQDKRAEIRSKTFEGIATAMANQYTAHLLNSIKKPQLTIF